MIGKKYSIPTTELREVATGHGACFASDRITVDGRKVGYMYREESAAQGDSGWRFFAGDESAEYTDVATNFGLYDVNTVANYDPEIVPYLDLPPGAALARDQAGTLVQVDDEACEHDDCGCKGDHEHGEEHEAQVVSGTLELTPNWSLSLPGEFEQHFDEEDLVLWRPGLTTYCAVFGSSADSDTAEERLAEIKAQISPDAHDRREARKGQTTQLIYRLEEDLEEGPVHACYTFVCGPAGHVQLAIYFDEEADFETALALCQGVDYVA